MPLDAITIILSIHQGNSISIYKLRYSRYSLFCWYFILQTAKKVLLQTMWHSHNAKKNANQKLKFR